jgi:hypothetical protein
MAAFESAANMGYGQHFGADRRVSLPVPVRRSGNLCFALLLIGDVVARAGMTAQEAEREQQNVTVPVRVHYLDVSTGKLVDDTHQLNEQRATHFGLPDPPGFVVGRLDDPTRPPREHLEKLRQRILAGLDVLLPFFADASLPWTEEANKAAQDVRDFFPVAAEPGLWPYYKAEGREFFAWVEKNAPPARAALPWESAK